MRNHLLNILLLLTFLLLPIQAVAGKSECAQCKKESKKECKAQCKGQRGKVRKDCISMCANSFCSLRCKSDSDAVIEDVLGGGFVGPGGSLEQGALNNQSCDMCQENYQRICNSQCRSVPQGERNECRSDCLNDSCGSSCEKELSGREKREKKRAEKRKCKSCKRVAKRSCNKECGRKRGAGFFEKPEDANRRQKEQERCHETCMKTACTKECRMIGM